MKQLKNVSAILLISLIMLTGVSHLFARDLDIVEKSNDSEHSKAIFKELDTLIKEEKFGVAREKIKAELKQNEHPKLHLFRAKILAAKGKKQDALNYLTDLIEKKGMIEYVYIRGSFLAELGYMQSAKQDILTVYQHKSHITPKLLKMLGALSLGEGDHKQALVYIKEAIELKPDDAGLWFDKAKGELRLELINEARNSCLKAITLDKNTFNYHKMYVDILGFFKSQDTLKDHLQKMITIFPNNPWVILRLSTLLIGEKKYYEAKEMLKIALKENPKNPELLFQIGTVLATTNHLKKAVVVFYAGIKEKKDATWAKVQLAKIYIKLNNFKSGILYLEEARTEKTKDLFVYETLAKIYNQINDTDAAEKVIISGLKIQPENLFLLLEYGNVLIKKQQQYDAIRAFEEALNVLIKKQQQHDEIQAFKKALSIRQSSYSIYGKLGNLYRLTKQYKKAETYLKKAIEINPEKSWVRAFYVELLFQEKRWQDALEILEEMIDISKKEHWPFTKKAIIEIKIREYENALDSIKKALKVSDNRSLVKLIKAEILEYLERYKEAETVYLDALKKQPNDSLISTKLAYVQVHLDNKRARKTIEKSISQDNMDLATLELLAYLKGSRGENLRGKNKKVTEEIYKNIILKKRERVSDMLDDLKSDQDPSWVYLNYLSEVIFEKNAVTPINLSNFNVSSLTLQQLLYLGNYALETEQYKHARIIFEEFYRISPDNIWGVGKLAFTYENLQLPERAIEFFKKFLEKRPYSNWALLRLAFNYDTLNMPEASEKAYLNILKKNPNDNVALNNLAWLYLTTDNLKMRKIDEALKLSMKAIKLSATPANLDTLAEAYFQKGEFEKALQLIQAALDQDKNKSDHFKKQKKKILKMIKNKEKESTR